MVNSKSTTREERAAAIIREGRVRLHPGKGIATVTGSKGESYTVTKTSCSCPDFVARGLDCKHRIASRILCGLYRECAKQARETGRVRVPVELVAALGGIAPRPTAPASAAALPSVARLIEIHDALDRAGLFDPNTPLPDGRVRRTAANPDGYCLRCGGTDHARCGRKVTDDYPQEAA